MNRPPSTLFRRLHFPVIFWLTLTLILNACSSGMRVKNFVNYPFHMPTLLVLDSLKLLPDMVKYTGDTESTFRKFTRDIRIQGRHDDRPTWHPTERGYFQVSNGATVHILDFNFQGSGGDTALIRVDSGKVVLENCDLTDALMWVIQVGPAGALELRSVRAGNLGKGVVNQIGGEVKIFNSQFDMAGETVLHATGGNLFETHGSIITNTMGVGIQLSDVTEVWLDSTQVRDSFQDGIILNDCQFVLLNHVESRENGRHGLSVNHAMICGLMQYSGLGNLVQGMTISDVDTLRVLNSEYIGNGDGGATIANTNRSRMAGVRVGHNGVDGFRIHGGEELIIDHSSFQANPNIALVADSITSISIDQVSVVNNGTGLKLSQASGLSLKNNLLTSNKNEAVMIRGATELTASSNLIKGNSLGLVAENILNIHLDSNRVVGNNTGAEFRSAQYVSMANNIWETNQTACYFSEIGTLTSTNESWLQNTGTAFEVLSAKDMVIKEAQLLGNGNGLLLNEASARIESCQLDSSAGFGLKLLNGSISINDTQFHANTTALVIGDGGRARIIQSKFIKNNFTIDAQASVALILSYCTVQEARNGIRIGNYGQAEILSSNFSQIDDYSIELEGPHLQSLTLRQNVFERTGGILNSKSNSGQIDISSNTFVSNAGGLQMLNGTLGRLDHNIFYHTSLYNTDLLKNPASMNWNCLFPWDSEGENTTFGGDNIYSDPHFADEYFLNPQSACLTGGENGILIGALGEIPESRPELQP